MCYTTVMRQIIDTYRKTGNLHHAYGILGEQKKVKEELSAFLIKDLKFPLIANPDFWQGDFNVFKIEDSRVMKEAHLNRPVKYGRKIFIISANFMTRGAQNSLLKIFEEPRADTVFFLILPSSAGLLPTLKSRIIFGKEIQGNKNDPLFQAEEFLKAKTGARMETIAKISKNIKEEKMTKSDAITFLKNLEKVIKANLKIKNTHNGRNGSLLAVEDIEKAISYAGDEAPSIKVILEHLALVL